MRKILYISDNFSAGGLETHLETYFRTLKKNYSVGILFASSFKSQPYFSGIDLFADKIFNIEFKDYSATSILRLKNQIQEIIKHNGIDLIHAHPFISIISSFLCAVEGNIPFAFTLHGKASLFSPDNASNVFLRSVIFENALGFSVNPSVVPSNNIHYLPNPIDEQFWKQTAVGNKGYALIVSRLDKEKSHAVDAAINKLKQADIPVVIAGDGSARKTLEDKYRNVKFLGFKFGTELKKLMEEAAFVCGMGRVVLESVFLSKPTVVLNYEGNMILIDEHIFKEAEKFNFNGSNFSNDNIDDATLKSIMNEDKKCFIDDKILKSFSSKKIVEDYFSYVEGYIKSFKGYNEYVRNTSVLFENYLNKASESEQLSRENTDLKQKNIKLGNDINVYLKDIEKYRQDIQKYRENARKIVEDKKQIASELEKQQQENNRLFNLLDDIYSSKFWKLASRYYKVRDNTPVLKHGYRFMKSVRNDGVKATGQKIAERIEEKYLKIINKNKQINELKSILKKHKGKTVIIFPPIMDWNIPLFQRPQHLAKNLAKFNLLYFYCTKNIQYDSVNGFEEIADGCYLTNRFDLVDNIKDRKKCYDLLSGDIRTKWGFIKERLDRNDGIIYQYIDEISSNISGVDIPKEAFEKHFNILKDERCIVITSATKLHNEVKQYRDKNHKLVTNGVEIEHFSRNIEYKDYPDDIKRLVDKGVPIIGYFGAFASWFDYELVKRMAKENYEILLLGWDYDGSMKRSGLKELKNVTILGPIPYKRLPYYASCFNIATVPFLVNEVTKSTSPIKLFEYMALGKPIVTTDLPECRKYPPVLIGKNHKEFIDRIDEALKLQNDEKYIKLLKNEAQKNSWEAKAKEIADMIRIMGSRLNI